MAKETYKIIFLEDSNLGKSGEVKIGLTFDQQVDFLMENLDAKKAGIFRIESEHKPKPIEDSNVVKKSDTEKYNDALALFYDSLNAVEMISIRDGKKKIAHNEQVGFYLKLIASGQGKSVESHVSVEGIREIEKRKIYKAMKSYLLGAWEKSSCLLGSKFYFDNGMFNDGDLVEMVNELFKGKL